MTSETLRNPDPTPAEFSGSGFGASARRLFNATRPKFYPASVLPVLAGSAWGFQVAGSFDWLSCLLALGATVCVHAGANVLNDVGDDEIGTDPQNENRIYPYTGGSRFIQAGIMSRQGMFRWGVTLLAIAVAAGAWLLMRAGTGILWFGLAGLVLAVTYSLGPLRLSALGIGESAVGIAFGILPVAGAAWLQSGVVDGPVIFFAIPVALWVAAILLINEVPDIAADAATGKRTLPVRFGLGGTAVIYLAMNGLAVASVAWLTIAGALPTLSATSPMHLRPAMTKAIEATLGIHTIGSLWLAGTALYVAFVG